MLTSGTAHAHATTTSTDRLAAAANAVYAALRRTRTLTSAGDTNSVNGCGYVASEALFHLLGGKRSGWQPHHLLHEGVSHWFLRHRDGTIVDVTADQFTSLPRYENAAMRGFLTVAPGRRAAMLLRSINLN